jgi:DNA-binding transcriptional regulator YdaS (Cro superfamily)
MLLSDWLTREGIARIDFASRIGVAPSVVTELCNGKNWLGREVARSIERETDGEVTANDFVHLGSEKSAEAAE